MRKSHGFSKRLFEKLAAREGCTQEGRVRSLPQAHAAPGHLQPAYAEAAD
jgi:hypothetical protein